METSNIAVLTVPLTEWNDFKKQLVTIGKSLLALQGKDKSEYLTPKEVCELLKCSRNTYENYVRNGILTPIKIQSKKYSKLLFKRIDVEFYLNSRIACN